MSLELYSLIPGQQVKRDRDLSNVTIQCDPLAVYPDNRTAAGVATAGNRFKPGEAGKLAVEDEICDLTINGNLEVKGKLKVSAFPAEICNIFCPEDFNLVAVENINATSGNQVSVVTTAVGVAPIGNIKISATGGLTLGSETSQRETAIRAGNIISIGSAAGNSQGIHMNFSTTDTDNLRMTQADAAASDPVAGTQTATANGVNGKITLSAITQIPPGTAIGVELQNTKIGTDSVVLYTLDVNGSQGSTEPIVVQGIGNPTAGEHDLVLTNVGSNLYQSSATARIVINYLVINPV